MKNLRSRYKLSDLLPYLFIVLFNYLILAIYPSNTVVTIPTEIVMLCLVDFYVLNKLKNLFNKIIAGSWLIFFFLGILNINSVRVKTNIWNLEIYDASMLFVFCLLIFSLSLLIFEKQRLAKIKFRDDLPIIVNSSFSYLILLYPILLILDVYKNLGFFPLLSGASFVNEMYEYDYGILYNFKIVSVYSFLLAFLLIKEGKSKLVLAIYFLFLIFVVSVDGKRFILLLSLLSLVPLSIILNKNSKERNDQSNNLPVVIGFSFVGLVYVLVNILRSGGDISNSLELIIDNIPFGVEFKDYVHVFNTYSISSIRHYNFELSAIGSFLNSSLLEVFNLNKKELYEMGSQHAIMNLYNEVFGIRIGIIGELYFAYGFFVIPAMVLIAFFTNKICQRIVKPKSYFNLFQNSILFALFVLLINGQATVFFGSLTLLIYTYFIYIFSSFYFKKK